jgi:hypothetical protein
MFTADDVSKYKQETSKHSHTLGGIAQIHLDWPQYTRAICFPGG